MFPDTVRRWLYRRRHASGLARLLNGAQARLAAAGVGPRWLVMVEVTGRRSGKTISFPAVVADDDNGRYLVSMLGEDTNWVRNVRASRGYAVLRHGDREPVTLQEVDVERRAAILRCYLQRAPGPGRTSRSITGARRGVRTNRRAVPDVPGNGGKRGRAPVTRRGRSAAADGPQTPGEHATANRAPPGLATTVVDADGAVELITSGPGRQGRSGAWRSDRIDRRARLAGPRIQPALGNPHGVEHLDQLPVPRLRVDHGRTRLVVYGRKRISEREIYPQTDN